MGVGPHAAELPVSSEPLCPGHCYGESYEPLRIWRCCCVSLKVALPSC